MTEPTLASNGFAPIAQTDAKTLILGSMPSVESLKQQHYYAHPRNGFWPIMAELFNFEKDLAYPQRCQQLIANKIALWDVLKSCQRQGSLDSNIKSDSIITNDFTSFLQRHPSLTLIVFNGAAAEKIFNKHVLPTLSDKDLTIPRKRLPSTSPAHASIKLSEKMANWKHALSS